MYGQTENCTEESLQSSWQRRNLFHEHKVYNLTGNAQFLGRQQFQLNCRRLGEIQIKGDTFD